MTINPEFYIGRTSYQVSQGVASQVRSSGFGSLKSRITWSESDTRFNFAVRTDEPGRLFKKLWVKMEDDQGHSVWVNKNSMIKRLGDSPELKSLLNDENAKLSRLFQFVQASLKPPVHQAQASAVTPPVHQTQASAVTPPVHQTQASAVTPPAHQNINFFLQKLIIAEDSLIFDPTVDTKKLQDDIKGFYRELHSRGIDRLEAELQIVDTKMNLLAKRIEEHRSKISNLDSQSEERQKSEEIIKRCFLEFNELGFSPRDVEDYIQKTLKKDS